MLVLRVQSMPLDAFEEAVHEVHAKLFAVGQHVDSSSFLGTQPLQRSALLALL